jgi:tRNA-dihydrouridine synthase
MFDETGCAGVSIGRGAFYNPWIFQHTLRYLDSAGVSPASGKHGEISEDGRRDACATVSEPSFDERVRVMCRHLDLMVEVFGEELGCRMFRKVAPWYAKRFGPASEFNKRAVRISTKAEFHDALQFYRQWREQFLDEHGELKPKFRPPPMVASFMQEPAVAQRQSIPVPQGPVEVW